MLLFPILCEILYSPRNDPDLEMIPNSEVIPKSAPKLSRPRNDPHISFIITLISQLQMFLQIKVIAKFPLFLVYCILLRRRKLIYYIRQNGFTFPNYWAIHSPMFPHHSLIPWGSLLGRQEEKWESIRGRFGDHLRVGIISGAVQF